MHVIHAWLFSPQGFLPPSEGLEIVPIGTVSYGQLAWPELVLDDVRSMALSLPYMSSGTLHMRMGTEEWCGFGPACVTLHK